MLFKFLKLFGLDVPSKMEAAKASLGLRFEYAKDDFTRMAVQAAVIAALLVFAEIAGAMALGVALFALYQFPRIEKRPDTKGGAESAPATADGGANESDSVLDSSGAPAPATASARDLVEPMAFVMSKVVKYRGENPVVDELIGNLRETALVTADEAIARAADVIRKGDRIHLLVALSGAVIHRLAVGTSIPALIVVDPPNVALQNRLAQRLAR
jgi:hypothetical protein